MNSICVGDIFECNVKEDNSIFWKKSRYLFVKDIQQEDVYLINSKTEENILTKTFIQHLISFNMMIKVQSDNEKAKALLTSFGKARKTAIITT